MCKRHLREIKLRAWEILHLRDMLEETKLGAIKIEMLHIRDKMCEEHVMRNTVLCKGNIMCKGHVTRKEDACTGNVICKGHDTRNKVVCKGNFTSKGQ